MKLGNQVEWAIHCMELLARVPEGVFIPTKVLAEFHGVPKEYLSKAMQSLAAAELIEGTLGPRGGYRIARDPAHINLLEIVEAVEGQQQTFQCQEIRYNNPCLKKGQRNMGSLCVVAGAMLQAEEAWRKVLREKRLSDIVRGVDQQVPSKVMKQSEQWITNAIS